MVTLLAITFGGALFEYLTYDDGTATSYSFCLVALVMRLSLAVWERPRVGTAARSAAAVGLVGLSG